MKMFCMWHPKLGWGAPRPTLFLHKIEAVRGTGLTLTRMRELGWKWLEVEVPIEKLEMEIRLSDKTRLDLGDVEPQE